MSNQPLDRAALALGAAGVVAVVFVLTGGDPWQFVRLGAVAAVVTVVLGGIAVAGGRLGRRSLVLTAGAGYLVGALLQLVQFGRPANWLGGNGSTFAFFLGLGVGLVAVAIARNTDTDSERHQQ